MTDIKNESFDIAQLITNQVGVIVPELNIIKDTNQNTSYVTGAELLLREVDDIPCLVDPFLPRSGVAAIAGASDTGKSSILRQLAIDVCSGDTFLGFTINSRYKRAIYVSTEDDETAVSYLLNKQNKELCKLPEEYSNLIFVFDTVDLEKRLDKMLSEQPADLVVIDCFTDIYGRSMNQANEVRTFLNQYSQLANKHQCLVIFLHHTGKGRENDAPSKNNLLGSQSFEAKMRLVIELRNDLVDDHKKHLCIVKGNYLPAEYKKESYVLEFSENMVFTNTGDRCMFDMLVKNDEDKKEQYEKILSMHNAGYTYVQIANELGYKSKGTISKIVKKFEKVSTTFPEETNETKRKLENEDNNELLF